MAKGDVVVRVMQVVPCAFVGVLPLMPPKTGVIGWLTSLLAFLVMSAISFALMARFRRRSKQVRRLKNIAGAIIFTVALATVAYCYQSLVATALWFKFFTGALMGAMLALPIRPKDEPNDRRE